VLDQLAIGAGETLLLLGGAGSVGIIATQLAVSRDATVIAAASPRDHEPRAHELGVTLSAPNPDRPPRAVDDGMALLAAGTLRTKQRRELPLQNAAEAHRLLESGETHDKIVLSTP
jgi:NADPH:quinone reductase-like Zn-dependent oxidoreductase